MRQSPSVADSVVLTKWCGSMSGLALGRGYKFARPKTYEHSQDQLDIEIEKICASLEAGPLDRGSWNVLSVWRRSEGSHHHDSKRTEIHVVTDLDSVGTAPCYFFLSAKSDTISQK